MLQTARMSEEQQLMLVLQHLRWFGVHAVLAAAPCALGLQQPLGLAECRQWVAPRGL
jgi:hypothetical protein